MCPWAIGCIMNNSHVPTETILLIVCVQGVRGNGCPMGHYHVVLYSLEAWQCVVSSPCPKPSPPSVIAQGDCPAG